mmetsp:Transcript_4/g.17  ORF Transcript_4/g.17 Transcript_4/m.17 type:complete len:81 (+) Transcript_4:1472-1714(+)
MLHNVMEYTYCGLVCSGSRTCLTTIGSYDYGLDMQPNELQYDQQYQFLLCLLPSPQDIGLQKPLRIEQNALKQCNLYYLP